MRFRLIPRDEGFYPLFEQAAANATACAKVLAKLLKDLPTTELSVNEVVALERKGDDITRMILSRLNDAIVTPFDREDIYALADRLDDSLDDMRAAADIALLHRVDGTLPGLDEMAAILIQSCEAAERLMGRLRNLRDLDSDLEVVKKLERDGDALNRRTVAELFSGSYDALTVLKWKDVVEAVEQAVNAIEGVANLVSSIAVKHA
jgi:uncharacterized protein